MFYVYTPSTGEVDVCQTQEIAVTRARGYAAKHRCAQVVGEMKPILQVTHTEYISEEKFE